MRVSSIPKGECVLLTFTYSETCIPFILDDLESEMEMKLRVLLWSNWIGILRHRHLLEKIRSPERTQVADENTASMSLGSRRYEI